MSNIPLPCAFVLLCIAACGNSVAPTDSDDASATDVGSGARFGSACSATVPCRSGLQCTSGLCQPTGSVPTGGRCVITADCQLPNYCATGGTCAAPGNAGVGDACTDTSQCIRAAVCYPSAMGTCSVPRGSVIAYLDGATFSGPQGMGQDLDGPCETVIDCVSGLACSMSRCV